MTKIICLDFEFENLLEESLFELDKKVSDKIETSIFNDLFFYLDAAEQHDMGNPWATAGAYFIQAKNLKKLQDAGYEIRIMGDFDYITLNDVTIQGLRIWWDED